MGRIASSKTQQRYRGRSVRDSKVYDEQIPYMAWISRDFARYGHFQCDGSRRGVLIRWRGRKFQLCWRVASFGRLLHIFASAKRRLTPALHIGTGSSPKFMRISLLRGSPHVHILSSPGFISLLVPNTQQQIFRLNLFCPLSGRFPFTRKIR